MALRTNSKAVKEAIKNYIMDHFNNYYYPDNEAYIECLNVSNYADVCKTILNVFNDEMVSHNNKYKAGRTNLQELFVDWCSGLCSALDTMYYYNISAVDLLGSWLQETEEEKSRFTEEEAEKMITYLLFRELTNNATK